MSENVQGPPDGKEFKFHLNEETNLKVNMARKISGHTNHKSGHNWSYSATRDRIEDEKYNIIPMKDFVKECEQNHCHQKSSYNQNNQSTKKLTYQNREYDIAVGSSYICVPVNNKKETVRINDLVVKDNLVLCCKPRTRKTCHTQPNEECIHTQAEEELKGDVLDYQSCESQKNVAKSDSVRHDSLVLGNPSVVDGNNHINYLQVNPSEALERKMRCTKLSNKFKGCLWALFFIAIFLVIIGSILLVHTLLHCINKYYINIVIEQTGFVNWIWVLMILSGTIIIVGIYGIVSSIDRGKRILDAYCTVATILALIIIIYLLFLWLVFGNMKEAEYRSMRNTFKVYRCNRYIRSAWDDLQENHKCCGIENHGNWKYIPPSCCNGTTKQEKIACVAHYISADQAYSFGCKYKLQEYFIIFFVFAACLLLLAFFLLILSLFASLWLLGSYKQVEKCMEVYYISR